MKRISAGLIVFAVAVLAEAAPAAAGANDEVARRYAPGLWYVGGEAAYPTLPYALAFDGVDNDEDGCTDLEDPDEIGALAGAKGDVDKRRQVERLLERLRDLRALQLSGSTVPENEVAQSNGAPKNCSRTYPVSEMKLCRRAQDGSIVCGPDAVVLYVEQRGLLSKMSGLKTLLSGESGASRAIQYWSYYAWDAEHLHDGEHVTVFVDGRTNSIRAVIGAGHLPSTPNNVLVAGDETGALRVPYPQRIPAHIPFLVEFGKHASAPDLNCSGRFDPGQDANDLPSGAWGTRDANYAVGGSSWGPFRQETSFSRDANLLIEASAVSEPRGASDWTAACPRWSLGRAVIEARLASSSPVVARLGSYRLVRAETVRSLFSKAVAARSAEDILGDPAYAEMLGQGPLAPPPSTEVDIQAVKRYWGEVATSSPDPRPDVWNHPDFGTPERDFKLDLFPTLSLSGLLTLEGGNGKAGVSLRIAGKGLLRDKSVELQALVDHLHPWGGQSVTASNRSILATGASGIQAGAGRKWEGAVLFNLFSTSMRGVYFGGSVRAADFTFRREWVVPNGVEGARSGYVVSVERLPLSVNAEAGYSYRLPFNFPMSLRVGLSGPLFRQSVTPDDASTLRYYRYPNPVDVRISFEFGGLKLKGRRHPLTE